MLLSAPCDRPSVSEARASWLTQLSSGGPASPEERPGNGLELRVGARERIAGCGGKFVEEDAIAERARQVDEQEDRKSWRSRRSSRGRKSRRSRPTSRGQKMLRAALARASLAAPRGLAQRGIIAAPRGLLARALSTAPPAAAAANTGAIVEIASAADFETLVMKASTQAPPVGGPVILDLYADWCEPCKKLTPILERLVVQSAGSVRLAKVDVDKLPELAQALQVKSMPTVMLVHQGKLVDSFVGLPDDAAIAAFVQKATELAGGAGSAQKALEAAAAFLEAGDLPQAAAAYSELAQLPEHAAAAAAGLAMCALKDDNLALAQDLVADLTKKHPDKLSEPTVRKAVNAVALAAEAPAGDGRSVADLRAALELDAKDHAARYELAQALYAGGDSAGAVDELLTLLKKDKTWSADEAVPRDFLFKIFEALGNGDDVTKAGRRRLANIMLV